MMVDRHKTLDMFSPRWSVFALLLAVSLYEGASGQVFPSSGSDVTPCSAKDPNINQCFLEAANKIIPNMLIGLRQIDAIPLDPLEVNLLRVDKGNEIVPTLGFNFTNNHHLGWRDAKVTAASVDPRNYRFSFTVNVPVYQIHGPYEISGTVLFIPLEGHGNMDCKIYNYVFNITIEGEPVTINGQTHLRIKNLKQRSTADDAHLQFHNLFGDERRSASTNALINLNMKEIKPLGLAFLDRLMEQIYTGILQRIFNRVPYSAMFTDLH